MELSFKKVNEQYESEISVKSDFNIHLEREKETSIMLLQKTSGTSFIPFQIFKNENKDFECDFVGYVYPKQIKIISYSKVNKGYVTENS